MLLGWTPEYSLAMDAHRFFRIYAEAVKLDIERHARTMNDLVDIAFCAQSTTKWAVDLKKHHQSRYSKPAPKVLDNKTAGRKLMQAFQKAGQNG